MQNSSKAIAIMSFIAAFSATGFCEGDIRAPLKRQNQNSTPIPLANKNQLENVDPMSPNAVKDFIVNKKAGFDLVLDKSINALEKMRPEKRPILMQIIRDSHDIIANINDIDKKYPTAKELEREKLFLDLARHMILLDQAKQKILDLFK